VLQALAPLDETTLQVLLGQLVAAELLYQRGRPPRATYMFKHALIQDAAYASLLKSTRQQMHRQVAEVLEAQFPETVATQPELAGHHFTEAGLSEQAVPYWQRAGQQALQRSANPEAVRHLTKGLELLATLPETPVRAQQELDLQIALGPALSATKGLAAPEVEQAYARAWALCQHVGETPQLFPTLRGLCEFYRNRGAMPTARELGEQLFRLAQREADPIHLLEAHEALGTTLLYLGEYPVARMHLEQGIALTDPVVQRALAFRYGVAPGVRCLTFAALTLWCLGYPTQAVRWSQEALALAVQSQGAAALAQMRQGLAATLATGQELTRPLCLVLLAEAAGHLRQVEEGLRLLAEALTAIEQSGRRDLLAEAYRLQGELLLRQAALDATQAEDCFQQALAIARRHQAKSWELRAALSLSRLWQQQGKRTEAYDLLAPIYRWFTEGFDTADLQEAKALLEELER
jgi:predicted ATPase